MASPGLLFLLLMSFTLLLCSLSSPSFSKQQKGHHLQKRGAKAKAALSAADYIVKCALAASPFIEMIPIIGPYINNLTGLVKFGIDSLKDKSDPTKALLKEFENLNHKIKEYHIKQKWDTWASQYAEYENNIVIGMDEFNKHLETLKSLPPQTNNEARINSIANFKSKVKPLLINTEKLHKALTGKGVTFSTDFPKLLSDHLKCHEKEIKLFTLFINVLIYKGNTVNLYYNNLQKTDDSKTLTKIAFECAEVMFKIHTNCIQNSVKYVQGDVEKLIDESRKHQELAKSIRIFLEKNYDRYDWITVAFITKNSARTNKLTKSLNKHTLSSEFLKVNKGDITVAVARQVKGNHTKADKVSKAIEKCVGKSVVCENVQEKLSKCTEFVDGVKLNKTYSAVHAFVSKGHDSYKALDAKEAPDEEYVGSDNLSERPYIYIGECKKYKVFNGGQFRVLIKSDEEMMEKSPCDNLDCGDEGEGKCILLAENKVPVCECKNGRYGEHCEDSVEDYLKRLNEGMPTN